MGVSLLGTTRAEAEAKVASLTHQLDEAVATLEGLAPVEPPPGSVIRFRKFGYTWAAISIMGDWYVTQDGSRTERQGVPVRSWAQFLVWVYKENWGTIEVLS